MGRSADQRHRLGLRVNRDRRRRRHPAGVAVAESRERSDHLARYRARRSTRCDPGLVVRQESRDRQNPATARLERDSGDTSRSHRRDQVAADPATRPRRTDGRPRCDYRGVVAIATAPGLARRSTTRAGRVRNACQLAAYRNSTILARTLPSRCRAPLVQVGDIGSVWRGVAYAFSTPHHSAMNKAVALVDFRNESRSTYSLKPCIAAPLAPKHRLGML